MDEIFRTFDICFPNLANPFNQYSHVALKPTRKYVYYKCYGDSFWEIRQYGVNFIDPGGRELDWPEERN
ncbi:hypothetical protein KIN20_001262 [Parelaphostrongylus tenuis]|uniref:Uncharacterized protein n=1 Tax=Parelaphostrongylus tenuis TaxID=148309 RepID=A0AAD5LTE9_PARTN|nr:hypothetical protein KIN20_001262 [Parelaphostrongylus tenuis]